MSEERVKLAVERMLAAFGRLSSVEPQSFSVTHPDQTLGSGVIERIEGELGHRLPPSLREYYVRYDEWNYIVTGMSVLSVVSLSRGPDWEMASQRLRSIDVLDFEAVGGERWDWLVPALSRDDDSIHLVHRVSGETVWYGGEVIERFESFAELIDFKARATEDECARLACLR